MFKNMRRKDREISNLESLSILENGDYGVLSTINPDAYAYGVPLNYVMVNNNIYFHSAAEGSKLDNIRDNNKVSFCVVGKTELLPDRFSTKFESVIVFGKAVEVYDQEKENALLALIGKYAKEHANKGTAYVYKVKDKTRVIKIVVEHITGKART